MLLILGLCRFYSPPLHATKLMITVMEKIKDKINV